MIILSIVSLLFSFLLQGIFFNFIPYTISNLSIFCAIFVLINLVVLQEYYEDSKKFLVLIVVFGLLMDIVYNSTAFLSVFIFLVIFYINKGLLFMLSYNLFTVNLFSLISMIIYHFLTFAFLIILKYDSYSILVLLKIIGCNVIMTILYTSLLYYVVNFFVKKFNLRVVR